ncbi:MAG: hypothetical protein H7174_00630 [Flavobacterium sp.]|nr:hypothetical protein [Flavobacterium sp.]
MKISDISSKLLIPIMIVAIFIALDEQSKPNKNVYISIIAIVVFIFGMMKLSSKTPSKNPENQDDNV